MFRYFYRWIISKLSRIYLFFHGVTVGKNFVAYDLPFVVKDKSSQIVIGNNVLFKGRVDLRANKASRLYIGDNCRLDREVRIVTANDSLKQFKPGCDIGAYTIINAGTSLTIGEDVLIAGLCYIQTSNHNIEGKGPIMRQGYVHRPINIGAGSWLGGGSFILPGVSLGNGCVVGANSVVTNSFSANCVLIGSPAIVHKERKND